MKALEFLDLIQKRNKLIDKLTEINASIASFNRTDWELEHGAELQKVIDDAKLEDLRLELKKLCEPGKLRKKKTLKISTANESKEVVIYGTPQEM